jgi:hypothetical protein
VIAVPNQPVVQASDGGSWLLPWGLIGLGLLLALVTAAAVIIVLRRRARGIDTPPPSTSPYASVTASPGEPDWARIDGLIRTYDLATSDAARDRIAGQLAADGVRMLRVPAGTPVDPTRHNVVGTRAADPGSTSPGRAAIVAAVIRPGWVLGASTVVRPADVHALA